MIHEYCLGSSEHAIKRDKTLDHKYEVVYYKNEKLCAQYTDEDEIRYYEVCDTLQELAILYIQQIITGWKYGTVVIYYDGEVITARELVLMFDSVGNVVTYI